MLKFTNMNFFKQRKGATILELFYDLIIVAALGGVVHEILHTIEAKIDVRLIIFEFMEIITYLLIWRVSMLYSSRFSTNTVPHRMNIFFQMIGFILIVSATYTKVDPQNIDKPNFWFSISGLVIVLTTLLVSTIHKYLYIRNKWIRKQLMMEIYGRISNIILALLWAIIFVSLSKQGHHNWAWGLSITLWFINIVSFVVSGVLSNSTRISVNTPDLPLELIKERYSILFMVFLGELIIQIVSSAGHILNEHPTRVIGMIICMFSIVFLYWWMYKDLLNFPDIIEHPKLINLYMFSMLFMMLSFVFIGIGFPLIIDSYRDAKDANINISSTSLIKYGAILLTIGTVWQHTTSPLVWISLKNYNLEREISYPRLVRIQMLVSPLLVWTYAWVGFVFPSAMIWILLCSLIFIIGSTILLHYLITIKNHEDLKDEAREFSRKDQEWINKNIKKYLDINAHKSATYKLNRFSELAKEKES